MGLSALSAQRAFTANEVYKAMAANGTAYPESTVFRTLQRMKNVSLRLPEPRLERMGREGFQLVEVLP
jgi:hypothetical protein